LEDDLTVVEVDDRTCAVDRTYVHRNFGEPSGEDEQMACDSLTFGPNSLYVGLGNRPTSVIWLRDAINQLMVAYAIPDGVCPFPTTTHFLGVHSATRGDVAPLCATLQRRGILEPLANRPLDFTLNGHDVGEGTTDWTGTACVRTPITLGTGAYPVLASFPGDSQYVASQDAGTLQVTAPALPSLSGPVAGAALPLIAPPNAPLQQPGAGTEAQLQVQAQSEAQAQTQAQSQAQANTAAQVQPGVMVRRQERVQVAGQRQQAANPALQATRLRHPTGTLAVELIAGALAFGFGSLLKRPALARARRSRKRSRPQRQPRRGRGM
jgi:hypothetical protein